MSVDWKQLSIQTRLNIVFYGRVSTEHEAQLAALKNQIQWYYDQLEKHQNWNLVAPIEEYLDRGITGTQAKKRPGFLRMIEDAKARKFDMVVTREVSRFGRNTVDTLKYVRELKAIGIQVYFVSDGIRTIEDNDGEYRLTIMAMTAQEESRKISERAKAGQYISRNNGVLYGTSNILGYTRIRKRSDSDKRNAIGDKSVPTFAIVTEEAETVQLIFEWYSEGIGLKRVKNKLLAEGRKNSTGQVKWFESSISRILSNPMYIGKQYQCQTEVVDFLEHTIKKNKKEDYVLIDGDFEPIISEELFNKVQEIKKQRQSKNSIENTRHGCRAATDKWINRLECGCGSRFQQYKWRVNATTGEVVKGYACRHRVVDGAAEFRAKKGIPVGDACSMPSIPAWKLDFMALRIFSEIWKDKEDCIADTFSFLAKYYKSDSYTSEGRTEYLKKQIRKYEIKITGLTELYTEEDITLEEFREKRSEYKEQLANIKAELEELTSSGIDNIDNKFDKLQGLKQIMDSIIDYSGEWIDERAVENYVDKVVTQTETEFKWFINMHGNAISFINENDTKRHNEAYIVKAQKTLELQRTFYTHIFTFYINFEDAKAFKKKFGKYIRPNQWKDLKIEVYMR